MNFVLGRNRFLILLWPWRKSKARLRGRFYRICTLSRGVSTTLASASWTMSVPHRMPSWEKRRLQRSSNKVSNSYLPFLQYMSGTAADWQEGMSCPNIVNKELTVVHPNVTKTVVQTVCDFERCSCLLGSNGDQGQQYFSCMDMCAHDSQDLRQHRCISDMRSRLKHGH